MPMGLFYLLLWTGPFPILGVSDLFLVLSIITEIPVFTAKSLDLDQMPRSAASELGLHCLPVSLIREARNKWVKLGLLDHSSPPILMYLNTCYVRMWSSTSVNNTL